MRTSSILLIPAFLATATMRAASRPLFPFQPVSIRSACWSGVTKRVACPPSTSTRNICSGFTLARPKPMQRKVAQKPELQGTHCAVHTRVAFAKTMTRETCSESYDREAEHRDHLPLCSSRQGKHCLGKTLTWDYVYLKSLRYYRCTSRHSRLEFPPDLRTKQ